MAIQDTQILMYTKHTLFLYFSDFSIFYFYFYINKKKLKTNKNMLKKNNLMHKTRCKCMNKKRKKIIPWR